MKLRVLRFMRNTMTPRPVSIRKMMLSSGNTVATDIFCYQKAAVAATTATTTPTNNYSEEEKKTLDMLEFMRNTIPPWPESIKMMILSPRDLVQQTIAIQMVTAAAAAAAVTTAIAVP